MKISVYAQIIRKMNKSQLETITHTHIFLLRSLQTISE